MADHDPRDGTCVTLGEILVSVALLLVAGTAWVSLTLAHLGRHDAVVAIGIPLVLLAVGTGGIIVRRSRVVVQVTELLALAALAAVAAVMFFPGFPYAVGDKDPGVYVAHGFAIERSGSYALDDETLRASLPVTDVTPGARFPGIWVDDRDARRIVPQFYHLLPAGFATAKGLLGSVGVFSLNGVAGLLSVLGLALSVRRVFGLSVGFLAGALLATNTMQVWHARYPTTEVLMQLFAVSALLGALISLQTGRRFPALASGGFVGLTFLVRPDGLLLVLLSFAAGCVALALSRFDTRWRWFAVGLAFVSLHAFIQAYGIAEKYSIANALPPLSLIVLLVAVGLIVAAILRLLLRRRRTALARVLRTLGSLRLQRLLGMATAGVAGVTILLAFLRSELFGEAYGSFNGVPVRTYDEANMQRLAWFFTIPGIVAMWLGFVVVSLQRWKASTWLLVLPGTLLLPVYVFEARVSPRLMWWSRRFVPICILAIVVLIAVAIGWALRAGRHRALRTAGVAVAVFLLAAQLRMSSPLLPHREFGGSYEVGERIAALPGHEPGLFLWTFPSGVNHPSYLFGSATWLIHGQPSALLPVEAKPEDVSRYAAEFPDRQIYVVGPGRERPAGLGEVHLDPALRVERSLPFWEESQEERPDAATVIPLDFTVWRVLS